MSNHKLLILPEIEADVKLRQQRLTAMMASKGIDALLISDNANLIYLCGRVFSGYILLQTAGETLYFVKRPIDLQYDNLHFIKKPENIAEILPQLPATVAFELDSLTYNEATRLQSVFACSKIVNASPLLRQARAVKTPMEIKALRESAAKHMLAYERIPGLYRNGMTDIELQIEIEREIRLCGGLGQFRIAGQTMEIFMGNMLAGDNADTPSPYDFAMGGEGLNPSLPVGANGSRIMPGTSIMVDMGGNFTGYTTDMTRTFSVGPLPKEALEAHNLSIAILHKMVEVARPGMEAKELYNIAQEMVNATEFAPYFMGHNQKAGFIGHGVGIEINEAPVLAPRTRDILEVGNVIAIEPKFVIPGVGAVGLENTYLLTDSGLELLTPAPEEIKDIS